MEVYPRIYVYSEAPPQPLLAEPGSGLQFHKFSGGEPHVQLGSVDHFRGKPLAVRAFVTSFDDLGYLLVLADALKGAGGHLESLFIPYFPGGRQDRREKGTAFTAKVYATIINGMGFDKVYTLDAHSHVTAALLDNGVNLDFDPYVGSYDGSSLPSFEITHDAIVCPDAGAQHRTDKFRDSFAPDLPVVQCLKSRDPRTGSLSNFRVVDSVKSFSSMLVVDDICDGGYTFLLLAKAIKEENPDVELDLLVTHGIFSSGTEALRAYYRTIYSSTSMRTADALAEMSVRPILLSSRQERSTTNKGSTR